VTHSGQLPFFKDYRIPRPTRYSNDFRIVGGRDEVSAHLRHAGRESHFGDAVIPTTTMPLFPNEAPFQLSGHYPASRIRFVHVPAGVREACWHIPPGRVLAVWLDGIVEFETSDGEVRRVPAGSSVLVEDTHGKGHISRHPAEGQSLILVTPPHGLDRPEFG
jgi:hypothetical protein